MSSGDLRVALYGLFVVLAFWQGSRDSWYLYLIGLIALNWTITAVEAAYVRWDERRTLRLFRRLDPELRDQTIDKLWFVNRQYLRAFLEDEAGIEQEGVVERFSFGTSDHRETTVLFWALASLALAAWLLLLLVPMPSLIGWALWILSAVVVLAVAWLRTRMKHLHTVLEVTPFGLTEIHPDGTRRYVKWTEPLELRNRPKQKLVELAHPGSSDFIALHHDRVGFHRLMKLVFSYGGFRIEGAA